jgi:hypothetical protein
MNDYGGGVFRVLVKLPGSGVDDAIRYLGGACSASRLRDKGSRCDSGAKTLVIGVKYGVLSYLFTLGRMRWESMLRSLSLIQ